MSTCVECYQHLLLLYVPLVAVVQYMNDIIIPEGLGVDLSRVSHILECMLAGNSYCMLSR